MPGKRCSVAVCTNSFYKTRELSGEKHVGYFNFPKDPRLRKQWVEACKRKDLWNPENGRVCSVHFKDEDFERNLMAEMNFSRQKKILKPGSVPSLYLLPPKACSTKSPNTREFRHRRKENKAIVEDVLMLEEASGITQEHHTVPCELVEETVEEKYANLLEDHMKLLEEFKALTLEHKACIKAHQREIDEREVLVESRVKEVLSKIFTDGQISLLLSDKKQVKCWTSEEIGRAFAIRYLSKRCYIHLRNQIKFPLPVKLSAVNGRQKSVPDGNEGDISSISYPTSTSAKDYRPFGDFAAEDMNSLAKKKPVLQMEKTQATKNKTRRRKELKTDEDEVIEYIEELEARKRASQCAVCSRSVINGKKEYLGMLTSTSGLSLLQCLIGISGNNSTKIKECSTKDVVCVFCAHLINYADKLEAELGKLKAAINGCLQIKSLSEEDQEMLKPQFNSHISILDEFSDRVVGPGSAAGRGTEKDKDPGSGVSGIVIQEVVSVSDLPEPVNVKENLVNSEREAPIQRNVSNIPGPVLVNANIVNSLWRNSMKTNVEKVRAHKPESSDRLKVDLPELACKICNLRTSSRAVLFYHLRRHMANYQWCDFCDAPIYDDENEIKKRKISVDPT